MEFYQDPPPPPPKPPPEKPPLKPLPPPDAERGEDAKVVCISDATESSLFVNVKTLKLLCQFGLEDTYQLGAVL